MKHYVFELRLNRPYFAFVALGLVMFVVAMGLGVAGRLDLACAFYSYPAGIFASSQGVLLWRVLRAEWEVRRG